MRKTIIFAAFAALAVISSCQKEAATEQESDELTFTASIVDQSTRTTIDTDESSATRGKVSWEVGDEITVSDDSGTAYYYIKSESDIAADGSATFTFREGSRLSSSTEGYTAEYSGDYGSFPFILQGQTYSTTVGNLPMSGISDPNDKTKLNFTVTCGLLKFSLTASEDENDKTIKYIGVSGVLVSGNALYFGLGCDTAESIASSKDFYLVLPQGEYTSILFTNGSGHICYKTAKEPMQMGNNLILPLTFTDLTFDDKLPGKFSVAPGKQVQFSRGNLQATCTKAGAEGVSEYSWAFAATQYDFVGGYLIKGGAYTGNDIIYDQSVGLTVDLFDWVGESGTLDGGATKYGISTITVSDTAFGNSSSDKLKSDWGTTIDDKGTWRTLTIDEWSYLLETRTVTVDGESKPSYGLGSIDGVRGMIILPDNWSGDGGWFQYGKSEWSNNFLGGDWMDWEDLGCVFLPAAYDRSGREMPTGTSSAECPPPYGSYWSSTSCPPYGAEGLALYLNFSNTSVSFYDQPRFVGMSVRLVSDTPVYYGNLNGGAANMNWGEDDSNNWE